MTEFVAYITFICIHSFEMDEVSLVQIYSKNSIVSALISIHIYFFLVTVLDEEVIVFKAGSFSFKVTPFFLLSLLQVDISIKSHFEIFISTAL